MTKRSGLFGVLLCLLMFFSGCTMTTPAPGSADAASQRQPEQERQIEIAIRDHAYVMIKPTPIRIGTPTVITLRNEDNVQHGFISPMLGGLLVRVEGEGITAWGKDVEGFHVDPGKTLTIRFTPERLGTLPFQCDIHREMKEGELLYLDIRPSRHR